MPTRLSKAPGVCLAPLAVAIFLGAATSSFKNSALGEDWPVWRGPNANGVANGSGYPTEWGQSKNLVWRVPVAGRGHSSPIVVGNRVFLTTADEQTQTQSVVCFDRKSGAQQWQVELNRGGFNPKIHSRNTHASPTPASDGTSLFVVFNHHQGAHIAALTLEGDVRWKKQAGGFVPEKYQFGYAASPLLYGSTVIVTSEFESDGFLAAFDKQTGQPRWRQQRPATISYSSPIVARIGGREQLLLSGCSQVASFDPGSGKPLWSVPGLWTVTCATMVWDPERNLVFASGGYPDKGTMAVKADGSQVVWKNLTKCYEQSMLVHEGHIYAVDDSGVAHCWQAETGRERWKQRLGGKVSSSPILAEGNVYVANESGTTFVFRATPQRFVAVAKNQLGSDCFATPAFCDGQIFTRVGVGGGASRREFLICIGE